MPGALVLPDDRKLNPGSDRAEAWALWDESVMRSAHRTNRRASCRLRFPVAGSVHRTISIVARSRVSRRAFKSTPDQSEGQARVKRKADCWLKAGSDGKAPELTCFAQKLSKIAMFRAESARSVDCCDAAYITISFRSGFRVIAPLHGRTNANPCPG